MVKESILVEAPESEPVEVAVMKAYLKVDREDDDDLIEALIKAARQSVESYTGRSLITQTRKMSFDYFPCGDIGILRGPIQSVDSIKYHDSTDTEVEVTDTDYWVYRDSKWPRVRVKNSWPAAKCRPGSVTITTTNGFGDAGTDVPEEIITCIKRLVAHWYEHREDASVDRVNEMPWDCQAILFEHVANDDAFY